MRTGQLFLIYLCILGSCFSQYVNAEKRSDMVQEEKFTISGNGSTNGNETKIDLHLETSQTLSKQPPVEAVATANLGKADPQVSHSQPKLPGGQKNVPHLNVPVGQVGPSKGSLAGQSVPHKTTAADPRLSPPKKGKSSNENSLPNPVANKPFPSGHIVPPVALPEKFPLPAEKPSVPKPSKSSKAQSHPRPVTNKAFPGGHIVPPVASPEKIPLSAEKPSVPKPSKSSKAQSRPRPVTNTAYPGGHVVPPVALPEKIPLPAEKPSVPKPSKSSKAKSRPRPVTNKAFPGGHVVSPVALPEKIPLPAEKPSVPKPSKSSKAQNHPHPVTNKAFPGGHIVPPVALPEKFPLPAEKPSVHKPSKASKAKNFPSPVTNKVFPGGHIVPPVALPEKIPLPDGNPTVPTPSKDSKAKSHPSPITNKAFPSGRILPPVALPDRININAPPSGKFPLPDAPSTVTFTSSDVSPLASPSSIASILPAQVVDMPTPTKASKAQSRPSPVANKTFPSGHNAPSVALPGSIAPTSTCLAEFSTIMPTNVLQNKLSTSSLPTPSLPAPMDSSPLTKPLESHAVALKVPITPSAAQTTISPMLSSPGSIVPHLIKIPTAISELPSSDLQFTFSREENISLTEHNFYRGIHKSAPINLNKDLVLEARKFSQKLAAQGKLAHESPDVLNKLGQAETVGMVCSKAKVPPRQAIVKIVGTWYEEACQYNFDEPNLSSVKATAHFTQLVWNSTTELGIGVAESPKAGKHCVYVVARYKPKGNIKDKKQFKINVKRGAFDPSLDCTVSIMKRFRIS